MCVKISQTLMLLFLFLSGAVCSEWDVEYHQQHICAVKGSSVVIPCSFYYPDNLRVTRVMWAHERSNVIDGPFIFDSEMNETASRFKYIGDKQHNCSFEIHNIEHNDTGKYTFRFITDTEEGKWTGRAGSTLKVVDLKDLMTRPHENRVTKEGDSVILTCRSVCDGDHLPSAFTWFRDGEPINEGRVLYLSNMNPTDSGNYSCSLKTHTGTALRVINIHVEYGPKNTSVSVRPSMYVFIIRLTVPVLLIVIVVAVTRLKKTRPRAKETNCEDAVYVNWSVFNNNQSQQRFQGDGATVRVVYTTVDFHTKRKSNMKQQTDSHHDEESVTYRTMCRNRPLDPSVMTTVVFRCVNVSGQAGDWFTNY